MFDKEKNILIKGPDFSVPKNLKEITENVCLVASRHLHPQKIIFTIKNNNLIIEEIENSENMSSEEFYDIILDKIIFFEKKWIKINNIDVSKILEKKTKQ